MSQSMSRRSLLVSFATVLSASALTASLPAQADCALPNWHVKLLTPVSAPLPVGTALVVAVELTWNRATSAIVTDTSMIRALLRQGRRTVSLNVDTIAPGLARLVPSARLSPGVWTLECTSLPSTRVTFNNSALPAPPPMPTLRSTTLTKMLGGWHHINGMGSPFYEVSIELASSPAPTWVAVIGNWASAWREMPSPASFGVITPGNANVVVLPPVPPCTNPIPGQRQPTEHMTAWYQLVDQYGQRSRTTAFAPLPPARTQ